MGATLESRLFRKVAGLNAEAAKEITEGNAGGAVVFTTGAFVVEAAAEVVRTAGVTVRLEDAEDSIITVAALVVETLRLPVTLGDVAFQAKLHAEDNVRS